MLVAGVSCCIGLSSNIYVSNCYLYNIINTLDLLIQALLGIDTITSLGASFIVFVFIFDTIYIWFML